MNKSAIDFYHDLLNNREYLDSTHQILMEATERQGLTFGKRPICTVLRPCFIDEATYQFVRNASSLVIRGIALLGRRLLVDAELRRELDLSADEEGIVQIDPGYGAPDVSGRLD